MLPLAGMNVLRSSTALVRAVLVPRSAGVCVDLDEPRCCVGQFVEPIISYISGSHCTDAVARLAETGEPFSTLEDACHEAMNKAILSTVMLSIVSYKKVPPSRMREWPAPQLILERAAVLTRGQTPEMLDMLRYGKTPASFEGASDDGRWSGLRCCGEWFSLIFLISYHHHQEHPVVRCATLACNLHTTAYLQLACTCWEHRLACCAHSTGDVVGAASAVVELHCWHVLRDGREWDL